MCIRDRYKVAPRLVQDAVAAALPGWDCLALGVPDPEWGQAVAVALAPATGEDGAGTAPSLPGLRAILRGTLPPVSYTPLDVYKRQAL